MWPFGKKDSQPPSLKDLSGAEKRQLGHELLRKPRTRGDLKHMMLDIEEKPTSFLTCYLLAEYKTRDSQLRDALRAAKRALELAPEDPRAAYAVASTYRTFTRAQFARDDGAGLDSAAFNASIDRLGPAPEDPNVEIILIELKQLGLTVEQAAAEALIYFNRTLEIGVRDDEQDLVRGHIRSIREEFPALSA